MHGQTAATPDRDRILAAMADLSGGSEIETVSASKALAGVAEATGSAWAFGTIDYAGQFAAATATPSAPGEFAVTFRIDQSSGDQGVHASAWPAWAYEIAKAAFLADKRVLVTYRGGQGGPFGHNLEFVTLSSV